MGTSAEILLVERSDTEARRVMRLLQRAGEEFSVDRVSRFRDAKQRLAVQHYDAVLVDPSGGSDGRQVVAQLHQSDRDAAIVVLSRNEDGWRASDAIGQGAQALVYRDRLDPDGLRDAICQAIARQHHQRVAERASILANGTSDGLRNVVESLPMGVIVHEEGNLLLVNAAAARIVRATGTCLWRERLASGKARDGLLRVHLGQQTYGLRILDRPTHWRNRRARLMTLHLIAVAGEERHDRSDPEESLLSGSLEALMWRHHRLQEFWRRLSSVLEAVEGDPKIKALVEEFEPRGLMSELSGIDARLRSLVERMGHEPASAAS